MALVSFVTLDSMVAKSVYQLTKAAQLICVSATLRSVEPMPRLNIIVRDFEDLDELDELDEFELLGMSADSRAEDVRRESMDKARERRLTEKRRGKEIARFQRKLAPRYGGC
ncbi:hypothetical protein HC891_03605 [Candidatus Gracilibacteria bacterium]|nr:hypothetical protein [Candidatus Gracilibacteria bacterium]